MANKNISALFLLLAAAPAFALVDEDAWVRECNKTNNLAYCKEQIKRINGYSSGQSSSDMMGNTTNFLNNVEQRARQRQIDEENERITREVQRAKNYAPTTPAAAKPSPTAASGPQPWVPGPDAFKDPVFSRRAEIQATGNNPALREKLLKNLADMQPDDLSTPEKIQDTRAYYWQIEHLGMASDPRYGRYKSAVVGYEAMARDAMYGLGVWTGPGTEQMNPEAKDDPVKFILEPLQYVLQPDHSRSLAAKYALARLYIQGATGSKSSVPADPAKAFQIVNTALHDHYEIPDRDVEGDCGSINLMRMLKIRMLRDGIGTKASPGKAKDEAEYFMNPGNKTSMFKKPVRPCPLETYVNQPEYPLVKKIVDDELDTMRADW